MESKLISERSRYELETNKSPLASDKGRQVGSTSEEPLSEEEAEKAEQEKMTVKMTCSKCGLTEFKSDMELKMHRDELHGYKSRSWKIHQDVIKRTYMPVNSLQIEKLLEMKW